MQWIIENPEQSAQQRVRGPPRRSHTKSRRGCRQCRNRHIKCDETQPRCTHCSRHDLTCVYGHLESSTDGLQSSPEPSSDKEIDKYKALILKRLRELDVPPKDVQSPIYRQEDTNEIIDHFLHHSELWLGTPEIQRVLQRYAVRWAISAPYVMYGLIATAAAHLFHCSPQVKKYEVAMSVHYALSLQNFALQLSKPITREVMDPLIACSIMHGPFAFWKQGHEEADDMPFRWLRTIRGVPVILSEVPDKTWIEQSVWYEYTIQAGGNIDGTLSLPEDPTVVSWARSVVEKFEELCETTVTENTSVYSAPLRHLSMLMRMNDHHHRSSATLRFNGHLSIEFVDLLEKGDTRALLLFCYWYGMMCNVKQWWAEQHSLRGCRRLCEILSACEDQRVQRLLDWPMIQAGMISTPRW